MTRPPYEEPRKGNPNRLTIRQHVFPAASIARFGNAEGRVCLHDLERNLVRLASPDDLVFCARRSWDQRAEAGYMKQIEDAFQEVAEGVLDGTIAEIAGAKRNATNQFFALWYMRSRHRNLDVLEVEVQGLAGDRLTREQEENLESNGYVFVREGGRFPARQLNGLQLQFRIHQYVRAELSGVQWGIVRAQEGEFIVPDVPLHAIVPIAPALSLVAAAPSGFITKENVAEINRSVRTASQSYYFARDFSCCPL